MSSRALRDCAKNQGKYRILRHLIQAIKESKLVKRSVQKKWDLDRFLEAASQRKNVSQQVKDVKEDFKILKAE